MPTLERDHLTTYAAPDVDPPWECEPEPDPLLMTECRVAGEERGERDFAAGIEDLPKSDLTGDYWQAWREGWHAGRNRAEAEWDAAGDTQTEICLPRVAA